MNRAVAAPHKKFCLLGRNFSAKATQTVAYGEAIGGNSGGNSRSYGESEKKLNSREVIAHQPLRYLDRGVANRRQLVICEVAKALLVNGLYCSDGWKATLVINEIANVEAQFGSTLEQIVSVKGTKLTRTDF